MAHRVGLDLNPVDLRDTESVLWLRALVWPEHHDRADLLQQAVELARQDPPQLIAGDALNLLPEVLPTIPEDSVLCLFHTHTINQFSPESRDRLWTLLAEQAAKRDLLVISMEWAGLDPGEPPAPGRALIKLASFQRGVKTERRLAYCDPHVRWIQWLEGPV